MSQISGYIEHIIYSNENNGYTVFELATDTDLETCVGTLHAVSEGENVALTGEYSEHSRYGRQFNFTEYKVCEASDEESIRRYLSSGAVKGIGKALAGRIVDYFGDDTLRVMEEEPECLAKIKGISARKAQEIAAQVVEKQELRRAMLFLLKFNISNNLAMKIFSKYGPEMYVVMEENPYRLADEIDGVGFKIADSIAQSVGIAIDSSLRIRCGIQYVISQGAGEGHTYLLKELLLEKAAGLLEVDEEAIWLEVENLAMDKKLIIRQMDDGIRVYSKSFYNLELSSARMLRDLDIVINKDTEDVKKLVTRMGAKSDSLELDELQIDAVVTAITCGVSIITGGPGTGKTTTINTLIHYLENQAEDFMLAAPTGRAAKRMKETTGYEASTIQRMLGLNPSALDDAHSIYDRNEDNPLETDTIIIDEMSMVDIRLFHALLKAIVPGTRLVLVGDTNQLPSVGPGSVLKDIIASDCFRVVRLEKVFRQAEESDIIMGAHRINAGLLPKMDNKSRDFFFLKREDVNHILKNMITLITEKLPSYVDAKSSDIQVLTPMRKGPLGVENLNQVLQKYLNPPAAGKQEKEVGGVIFRTGDKVMQIKNNYQVEWEIRGKYDVVAEKGLGVFNGDCGIVKSIDFVSESMEVVYEENHIITYPFANLDELELAYAVTIHKSQGSEYPAVIIPLLSGPKQLFNRNLLYTAVTRAKKCVVILGSENTVKQMVDNKDEVSRYTSLDEAIKSITIENI